MDLLEPGRSLRYRLVMRRTLRRASLVVANSRYTAQIAAARGARQKQIVVIQPGVDPNRYLPGPRQTALLGRYQIDAEVPVLVSVGRLIPRKGFDIVLQALPEILRSFPEAVYLIVGDGPDRERLAALANSLSVQRNVRFATEVPDDALPAYYQSADAFVMPSRVLTESGDAEGFGMVFLEAGCCELPVIGGRSGGIEDAVVDGVTGYLVDPASPVECADKIAALLSNPQLRKQMGTRARQRAVEEYQWTQVAGRYLEALGRNCFES
jgi:phosphatidylinositol alpha-1,6-mannosyltransferase